MRQPEDELDALKQASLLRRLPLAHDWAHDWANQDLINFASNDYLGLAHHRQIQAAYQDAIEKYGSGSTASRLICGTQPPHQELESLLAEAKGTEAALSFSTGYATSLGVLTALLKKGDTVILDKLCHASLIDGARLSGATIRVYPHNHLSKLKNLLASTEKKATTDTRTLVVTESVFSMDGDVAPLQEIAQLTRRYNSLLMVDEAHALGVHGATGMGLAEELNIQGDIDFHMGTLGKAAGVGGGYLAAKQVWIDLLVNRARSFIYSTAPPPAQAAAAAEAIRLIRSEEGKRLRAQLWKNIHTFRHIFHDTAQINGDASSAIIPWMVGDSNAALDLSAQLRDHGMLVPAIRYPTVPPNTARLRITLSALHQEEEIVKLAKLIT